MGLFLLDTCAVVYFLADLQLSDVNAPGSVPGAAKLLNYLLEVQYQHKHSPALPLSLIPCKDSIGGLSQEGLTQWWQVWQPRA